MSLSSIHYYRPEIDGLRAFAVLAVVAFHADIKLFGGYIGVDVFFVISGYLITSHILRDLDENRFSLISFWERRFRRILPALVVMVLCTLIVGGVLLLPDDYAQLGRSALWHSLFASNFYFWQDTGYFATDADEKPLLHTWSLAVEEQFYILIPLLLVVLHRLRCNDRRFLVLVSSAALAGSLFFSEWQVHRQPSTAFFLLPARAWELLVGVLIAMIPPGSVSVIPAFSRELFATIGLLCIGVSCLVYDREMVFPGMSAVVPVLGTALFIVANFRDGPGAPVILCGRLLAWCPIIFVGQLSYSLYLWHWPVLAFMNYWSFSPPSKVAKFLFLISSFLLAILSWKYVETPFRKRKVLLGRWPMLSFGAGAILALGFCGASIAHFQGLLWRVPECLVDDYARQREGRVLFTQDTTLDGLAADKLVTLGIAGPVDACDLVLWGDSHSMAAAPAFDIVCKEAGVRGRLITRSMTAPLLDFPVRMPNEPEVDTVALNRAVLDWLKQHHVRHVFLAAYWHAYEIKGKVEGVSSDDYLSYYQRAITTTVDALAKNGCQPWIMLQVPNHPQIVPRAYVYCQLLGADERLFCGKPNSWNGLAGSGRKFLDELEHAGAKIVDARSDFLYPDEGHYRISLNGQVLYGDKSHLTPSGAEQIIAPVLRRSLKEVFPRLQQD